jgi:hypothetical protein
MIKFFARSIVFALALVATPFVAQAQYGGYSAPPQTIRYAYESGSVAAGAVITSPVIDASNLASITFTLDPGAAATRSLQVNCLAKDGTTVLFAFPAVSAATGAKVLVAMSSQNIQSTAPTGVTYWAVAPCQRIQAVVAASGAVAAQLAIYGR